MRQKPLNEIVQSIINNIHDTLPQVDTKPGTFIRDVFINPISDEIAAVYGDMKTLELSQSIVTATGSDLDRLAANYFIFRKSATSSQGKLRFYIRNTDKSTVDDSELPVEIFIPEGSVVSTIGTYSRDPIQVKTLRSVLLSREQIKALPIDVNNGSYKFVELEARSLDMGSVTNVGAGELIQMIGDISADIIFVSNPYPFSGGTDFEDDNSLAIRVNLAISGSNIGTKDGYLSYVLKQNGVIDAKVVGAGDDVMFRDGGYISGTTGKYSFGKGGMVDIYVRGEVDFEVLPLEFPIDTAYISGTETISPYDDIPLPLQPVANIISITSKNTGTTFINAGYFETEGLGNNTKYYIDIEWNFGVTNKFPDTDYYSVPSTDPEQLKAIKMRLDDALQTELKTMINMTYNINRNIMDTTLGTPTELFDRYIYNLQVYKLKANTSSDLDGRVFIKKNDKMYVRCYKQPDYILVKEKSLETPNDPMPKEFFQGDSFLAHDKIKWLNGGNKPTTVGDTLVIRYNTNQLIRDLQDGIETKRILTADVLIKQARKLGVEIILEATSVPMADPLKVRTDIVNKVTTFINSIKKLGGEFDKSDIVAVVKELDDIDSVNLEKIQISELGFGDRFKITAADNQYLQLENIVATVVSP